MHGNLVCLRRTQPDMPGENAARQVHTHPPPRTPPPTASTTRGTARPPPRHQAIQPARSHPARPRHRTAQPRPTGLLRRPAHRRGPPLGGCPRQPATLTTPQWELLRTLARVPRQIFSHCKYINHPRLRRRSPRPIINSRHRQLSVTRSNPTRTSHRRRYHDRCGLQFAFTATTPLSQRG